MYFLRYKKMPYKKYFLHSFRLNLSNKGIDAVLACLLVALLIDEWWFFFCMGGRSGDYFLPRATMGFYSCQICFFLTKKWSLCGPYICCPSCFIVKNGWAVPSLHAGLKNCAPNPVPKLMMLEEIFLLLFIHFQSRA